MRGTLDYHLAELSIARNQKFQEHSLPRVGPQHRRILDIGCGMGQTLLALELPPEVEAHGVDPDASAIEAGKTMAPPNVHLRLGQGEKLPYPDAYFDLVICRVALPYMNVETALKEISRVSAPMADTWLMMHPADMYTRRALKSLKQGRLKDVAYCGFVLLNGTLLSATGKQISIFNRTETHQTSGGMRAALRRAGFESIKVERDQFFIAQGRKSATISSPRPN